ncbi:DUF4157 domain-containing protein [Amycolatopsis sp. cg9]|uniref:eCIS core domain-containing protein n=1 Tax=Amycolatopsis sp. cg9 TaxID=3238801 RepID=UPI003525E82E
METAEPAVAKPATSASPATRGLLDLQAAGGNGMVVRLLAGERTGAPPGTGLADRIRSRLGLGAPLPAGVRADMAAGFGRDLPDVRVHRDSTAATLAAQLSARAFTVGQDVFFGEGAYDPGSRAGRETLAHELTHTVQRQPESTGGAEVSRGVRVSDPHEHDEREAAETGRRVAAGQAVSVAGAAAPAPGGALAVRREPDGGASPGAVPAANLTNQALFDELRRLERGGSNSADAGAGEARYTELQVERDRRVRSGQVWLADGGAPTGLLQVAGGDAARIASPATDPRTAGGASAPPTFTSRQLGTLLTRHGVAAVVIAELDPAGTTPAAGAVPTPSLAPQLLGRYYPFLRAMTAEETAMVAQRGAVHLTPSANLPGIELAGGGVGLDPSAGYRNLTDPSGRPGTYFFAGEPTPAQFGTNLAGGGPRGGYTAIVVQGGDLPPGTLFRPLDSVLAVPGGYRGPATIVPPGQQIPPGNVVVVPIADAATMAESLRRQGTFSGHPLAAGFGAGVVAVVVEGGVVLVRTGELPSGSDLAGAGIAGTAGGAVGAGVETAAAQGIAGALGANSGRLLVVFGRSGAGALGGAVAAPVVELGRMLLDDRSHTGTDYAARGGRAAVGGAISGLLAAAATGAVAGSVAPGVGTAIGFVVGAGAYLLTDWLVGDTVEGGIRGALR